MTAMIEARFVDYVFHYLSPRYMSDSGSTGIGSARETESMGETLNLEQIRYANFEPDLLIRGMLV